MCGTGYRAAEVNIPIKNFVDACCCSVESPCSSNVTLMGLKINAMIRIPCSHMTVISKIILRIECGLDPSSLQ